MCSTNVLIRISKTDTSSERPVDYYWVFPPTGNGYCLDEGKVTLAAGVINCVSDLLCTVLPIPIIMRLQMPLKQRIGVCLLLCLGFIVTIAGVIRTYFIWKSLMDSWDETWYTYPLWIAAAVEIDLAVVSPPSGFRESLSDVATRRSALARQH